MTDNILTFSSTTRGLKRFFESTWRELRLRSQIRRERELLASLDDRALKDIGISRLDALHEARRDDVPVHRREARGARCEVGGECYCVAK